MSVASVAYDDMPSSDAFEDRIAALDPHLFDLVETQSNEKDRRSWLALQRAVRDATASYVYLEIGSYRGGSIQQYLQDPRCSRIYSIDNRTRDERHRDNSTAAMLRNLWRVDPGGMGKLACFDTDAREVDPGAIAERPDICFIDGWHTYQGVRSDFAFCLSVCARNAVIYFHDAENMHRAISHCLRQLRQTGRPYVAHKLPGNTFVVGLDGSPISRDPRIRQMAQAVNGERWLWTGSMSRWARRHAPDLLRPALVRVRDLWWQTPRG